MVGDSFAGAGELKQYIPLLACLLEALRELRVAEFFLEIEIEICFLHLLLFHRLNLETFDAFELGGVARDQSRALAARMGRNEEIERTDRRAFAFQVSSNLRVVAGVVRPEIDGREEVEEKIERASFSMPSGLFDSGPEFGYDEAGKSGFLARRQGIEGREPTEHVNARARIEHEGSRHPAAYHSRMGRSCFFGRGGGSGKLAASG